MRNRRFLLCILVLTLLYIAGCASNTVRLVYSPADNADLSATSPVVGVVPFTDTRALSDIGRRSDGSFFVATSEVRDWFTKELVAELTRQGVAAREISDSTADTTAAYTVKGTIDEVQLTEHSSTSYSCAMRASVTLLKGRTPVFNSGFNNNLSRRAMPFSSVPQEVLAQTQRELITAMAAAIKNNIRP